jgi:hypothetical protein
VIKALPATLTPVTTAAKVTYSWTGTPKGSPITKYDVYVRRAALGKVVPGNWTLLKAGLTARAYVVAVKPGETLYLSVRATDAAGTVSGFAASSKVVTSVMPASGLVRSKGAWTRVGKTTTYQTTKLGAAAQTASVGGVRRIYVAAPTGVGYGAAVVYIGKTKLKAISLATTKSKARATNVFVVALTAKQTATLKGAVVVKVTSKSKLVRLVGIGILR